MSIEALSWVLQHSRAVGTDKVVLMGIANHADPNGREAWPAVSTLARYANVSDRSVQRSIARLVADGAVSVEARAGGYPEMRDAERPNKYRVAMGTPLTPTSPPPGDAHVTPPGDAHVTPPGDAHVTTPVTPTSPEPSLEPSMNQPTSRADVSSEFEEFWKRYPRRAEKTKARAAWGKLSAGDRTLASERLAAWLSTQSPEPKFLVYPERYLKYRRWEDELPTVAQSLRPAARVVKAY